MARSGILKGTLVATALLAASPAAAQLDQWRFNEFARTTGTAANRGQFIELNHPNPGESVTGLSIVVVRTAVTPPYMFAYRIDLVGTATDNFYLVGSSTYTNPPAGIAAPPAPADQTEATQIHRPNGIEEFYLVPTVSIDPTWTVSTSTAAAYRFNGTEFNSGAEIIDKAYRISQSFAEAHNPPTVDNNGRWIDIATESDKFIGWNLAGSEGLGAYREGDVGPWIAYEFPAITGEYPDVPFPVTPGAPNPVAPPPPPPAPEVPGVETFAQLVSTNPLSGDSTISANSFFQERIFGEAPTPSLVEDAQAFPMAADTKYLRTNSQVDSILEVVEEGGWVGTDVTQQFAFAIRLQPGSLNTGDPFFNNIDLLLLSRNTSGSAGGAQIAGLMAENGVLKMSADNGWGSVVLSNSAFDGASPDNWADGQWRVLVARVTPSLDIGEPRATWWVVDPLTGDTRLLVDDTNLVDTTTFEPRANIRTDIVRRAAFGASIRSAQLPWFPVVDLDEFGLYSLVDHPTQFDFFTAVYTDYASPFRRPAPETGELNFGTVSFSDTSTLPFTITNEGTLPLTLSSPVFSGAAGYSTATTFPLVMPARSTADVEVTFSSAAPNGTRNASLTLNTDSPSVPEVTISLTGVAGNQATIEDWTRY